MLSVEGKESSRLILHRTLLNDLAVQRAPPTQKQIYPHHTQSQHPHAILTGFLTFPTHILPVSCACLTHGKDSRQQSTSFSDLIECYLFYLPKVTSKSLETTKKHPSPYPYQPISGQQTFSLFMRKMGTKYVLDGLSTSCTNFKFHLVRIMW